MIRDPSDGSVREPKKPRTLKDRPTESWERLGSFRVPDPKSGLPDRTEDPARLKKSEQWLRDYRSRK